MQNYRAKITKAMCPICYNENGHILWSINSKQAAQHFVLQEKSPERFAKLASHIEHLWRKDTCDVVQCDVCEFVYSNPYVAGDERFYRLAYDRSGYPTWKWEFQQTYDVLRRSQAPNTKLLEVGAGDGAFVRKIAEDIIPKENILCTEYSEYGRSQIEQFGVECLSEDIRELSNTEIDGSFDIVCMFQVLEHMDRLDVLFKKLSFLTREGGSLFIAVPNQRRIKFNELTHKSGK